MNSSLREYCYTAKDSSLEDRKSKIDVFKYSLSRINARLGSKKYHLGEKLTGADIYAYEVYKMMKVIHSEASEAYDNL